MGTNFYARIIPSKKRKQELHQAIDDNNASMVKSLVHDMYGSIHMNWESQEIEGGCVHLGKRSAGWKFLWNPNIFQVRNGHSEKVTNGDGSISFHWVSEPDTAKYLYPLTKAGIKAFIDREDIEIYDEYGEKQDKEQFFKEALEWTTWRGKEAWDSDAYYKEYPEKKQWSCKNEYTDFLESLGYTLSKTKSDFYSDGLRFSTSTEFC